ncbi:hypothetical protein BASA81_005799 [Batrachochytrium salamandrivorans]|nr:hypothetical protein BASA81_005799 [Batrachochytrium salamandrivorans]
MLTPCVAGVATITDKPGKFQTPSEFFSELVIRAVQDAGFAPKQIAHLVTDVVTIRMQPENMGVGYKNLAHQVSKRAGVWNPSCRYYKTSNGGDTPQKLVNQFSNKIALGESKICILVGGELLDTFIKLATKTQSQPEWGSEFEEQDEAVPECLALGNFTPEVNDLERRNRLTAPKEMYAMMDQASRQEKRSFSNAFEENAKLFDALNLVASNQPPGVSWFPTRRTSMDIATPSKTNRWVSFPYTKYMNSVIQVNQGACIVLIAEEVLMSLSSLPRPIFLRGGGECVEPGFCVSERPQMYTSFGMMESINAALAHAGVKSAKMEIQEFDLYSCFPIALRVAKEHLGLDNYSKLTVTGGLPFYGGAGNAYTLCSIAFMVQTLRNKQQPHSLGLVNGNGWFMTKHSCGIYSNTKTQWIQPEDPMLIQQRANAKAGALVPLELNPNGTGRIESYIVDSDKRVVAFGRMISSGKRFLASYSGVDLNKFREWDAFGMEVEVSTPGGEKPNQFTPSHTVQWEQLPKITIPPPSKL